MRRSVLLCCCGVVLLYAGCVLSKEETKAAKAEEKELVAPGRKLQQQQCGCSTCGACAAGTYCQTSVAGQPGYCAPALAGGSPCGFNEMCQSGSCVNFLCTSAGPAPGTCFWGVNTCAAGTYCTAPVGGSGVCVAQLPIGSFCTSATQCLSGSCVNSICSSPIPPQQTCGCIGCAPCPWNQYCTGLLGGVGFCTAKLPNGASCGADYVCQSGNCIAGFCSNFAPAPQCGCPGCPSCPWNYYCSDFNTCQPKRSVGQSCNNGAQCQTGYCWSGVCQSSPPGQQCGCSGCAACPYNFYCTGMYGGVGYCSPKVLNGGSCNYDGMCQSGNCNGGTCTPQWIPNQCGCPGCPSCPSNQFCDTRTNPSQCQNKLQNGAYCIYDSWCSSGKCNAGTCTPQWTPNQCGCPGCPLCPSSQYCDNRSNQCQNKLQNGQSCLYDSWCISNNCNSGTCAPQVSPNQCNCPGCPDCAGNQYCDSRTGPGQCQPKRSNGTPCTADVMCFSNYCNPRNYLCSDNSSPTPGGSCSGPADSCADKTTFCQYSQSTGYICVPKRGRTDSCSANWECLSNSCSSGQCR